MLPNARLFNDAIHELHIRTQRHISVFSHYKIIIIIIIPSYASTSSIHHRKLTLLDLQAFVYNTNHSVSFTTNEMKMILPDVHVVTSASSRFAKQSSASALNCSVVN